MALQPVIRRSVPEQVFEQIATDVLSGEIQPGEALPSERQLADVLGVSRPAVREALKRLSAAGLIDVRHGGVTTVRDFRRHAGLDLLPRLLFRNGELDVSVVRSLLEARLRIGPKVAELAAERHGPELAELLEDSLRVARGRGGSGRVATRHARVLGSCGRRRWLDRIPVDVQRFSRRVRAGAGCPGHRDDRRGQASGCATEHWPMRSAPANPRERRKPPTTYSKSPTPR